MPPKKQGGRSIPPPITEIPPRGIGPISEPNHNDVLCGRGGRINAHEGNVQFRDIVNSLKTTYLSPQTKKLEKAHIAARIVTQIRTMDPPGRFLKEDGATGMWFDIGDEKARKKAGQALREDAPDIRPELQDTGGKDSGNGDRAGVKVDIEAARAAEKAKADATKSSAATPVRPTAIRTSPIVTPGPSSAAAPLPGAPTSPSHGGGGRGGSPQNRMRMSGRGFAGHRGSVTSPRFAPPHPMSYGYPPHGLPPHHHGAPHGGGPQSPYGAAGHGSSQGSIPSMPSPPAISEGAAVYHDGRGYAVQPQQPPYPQAQQPYPYEQGQQQGGYYGGAQRSGSGSNLGQRMLDMARHPLDRIRHSFSPLVPSQHQQAQAQQQQQQQQMSVEHTASGASSGRMGVVGTSGATFDGKPFHPIVDSGNSSSTVSELSFIGAGGVGGGGGMDISGMASPAGAAAGGAAGGAGEATGSQRSLWQSNHLAAMQARQERYQASRAAAAAAAAGRGNGGGGGGEAMDMQWSLSSSGTGPSGLQRPSGGVSHAVSHGQAAGRHGAEYGSSLKVSHLPNLRESGGTGTSSSKSGASRLSDLSMSLGFSGLNRSMSLPGLKSSDLMSLGDASFNALLEDQELAAFDERIKRENPNIRGSKSSSEEQGRASGSSGEQMGRPPTGKGSGSSSKSNVSALSSGSNVVGGAGGAAAAAGGVQRDSGNPGAAGAGGGLAEGSSSHSNAGNASMAEASSNSLRSSTSSWLNAYRGMASVGSDANPWGYADDQSSRSVLSEISTDLMALDLAADGPAGQTFPSA